MLGCCHKGDSDGFKVIVVSMFVFAVGVTVALIITIASGSKNQSQRLNVTTILRILLSQILSLRSIMLMW